MRNVVILATCIERSIAGYGTVQDSVVPYRANDSPSGSMSLQDIEDMNILFDIDFSSDDELPDLI